MTGCINFIHSSNQSAVVFLILITSFAEIEYFLLSLSDLKQSLIILHTNLANIFNFTIHSNEYIPLSTY